MRVSLHVLFCGKLVAQTAIGPELRVCGGLAQFEVLETAPLQGHAVAGGRRVLDARRGRRQRGL
eukprot:3677311-Lingulodinium_polyedra.AAC.1